ncbi:hypothetical protein NBRC10512_004455 [Rhodotorula toruloides]|uniref:RHTO0S10e05908g1_1 n=2 Tax=Rhodotorula toruloides TaxID=5286 RepID=A0A061B709_RHOTO|nr:uncharacterized protein RHTO_08092 [Rhodotorula toruloides NP11]EMS22739.1 hypothetical protein RHTO_08092 [Rhodotorula toruloides NP11]CDR45166.1 RHTO0S10e05908g1_1 [Rhodotorula toruloides]
MVVEGFKLDIDKTGRAVISTPTSKGASRVGTRSATFASPSKSSFLPPTRNTTPTPGHSAPTYVPSHYSPSSHDAGGKVGREEDEGRVLLKQFTFASPSPKKKRGAPLPMQQTTLRREKAGRGRGEGEDETTAGSRRARFQLDPFLPTRGQQVYELPVPPHLVFAAPRGPPSLPRLPSIGTTLSTLSLGEQSGVVAPGPQVTHVAPLALVSPPSPFPALASDLVQLLERPDELPDGLIDLLEACVAEGKAALETGERQVSALASKAGIMPHTVVEPDETLQDPPGHSRSVSLSSAISSTSLPSLTSARSSSFSAPSSHSPYYLSRSSRGIVDRLPACPPVPHPDYPRSFGRPLRFIFETGLESYEKQREGRNYLPELTPPPKKKRKKAGKAKGKHADASGDEEDEQDDEDSAYVPRANASRRSSEHAVLGEDFDGDGYELRRSTRVRSTQ